MSLTLIRASRFSARSAPTKSSTKSSAGAIRSSAGVAYWARCPPCFRIAIRSPILIASSMSWVTKRTVFRISACRRRNSFWRRSRLIGSIAPKGSSISITGGSAARARATPTLCCWPPESWLGKRSPSVRVEPDHVEQLADALLGALPVPAEQLRDRGDVLGDGPVREQAGLLDHVADLPAQLGRVAVADGLVADQDVALRDLDRPVAIRIAVVFPQPEGPTRTQMSPAGTSRERWLIAGTCLTRIPLGHVPVGNGRCLVPSLHCARSYPADRWRSPLDPGYHPPAAGFGARLFLWPQRQR